MADGGGEGGSKAQILAIGEGDERERGGETEDGGRERDNSNKEMDLP